MGDAVGQSRGLDITLRDLRIQGHAPYLYNKDR